MPLADAQIVDAIATRLAGTATLITTKRLHPLAETDLPAWRVFPGDVAVTPGLGGDVEANELDVVCAGFVRAVDDVDDAMNNLASAGLAAIHAVQAANYSVTNIARRRRMAGEGEAAMAVIEIVLRATFHTAPAAPDVLL